MSTKTEKTATRSVEDVHKWDDHLEKLIDAFKPFLLEKLRVSHLLCLIHIREVKDVAAMIHQKENKGDFQGACSDLLEAIRKSDVRGKWQMFIDALKEVDNTVILQTLLGEKSDDPWLDDQANRNLIELFSQDIERSLRLEHLLSKILQKELIHCEDMEKLRALIRDGKKREAIAVLVLLMHRNSSTWFSDFLTLLYEEDEHHKELAKLIDPGFCEKMEKKKRLAAMGNRSSAVEHGAGDGPTLTPSMVRNMGSNSRGGEKDLGDKSLPQAQQPHHAGYEGQITPAGRIGEATCTCKCCAQVLAEVASLRSELAELKSLIVANGKQHT